MNHKMSKGFDVLRVFGAPLCFAAASGAGFAAAFLFGEIGKYLSWLGIGLPLIAIAVAGIRRMLPRQGG
jgi:thiol:disulfide interchange protein